MTGPKIIEKMERMLRSRRPRGSRGEPVLTPRQVAEVRRIAREEAAAAVRDAARRLAGNIVRGGCG